MTVLRSFFFLAAVPVLIVSCKAGGVRGSMPIGVFDSGTGGLTVLERILTLDAYDNTTHLPGADGIPDFEAEDFEYLADQANMPYGVYDAQGKADFLRRLVLDDARFLLDDRYFRTAAEALPRGSKSPCKIIVIACNTATAYGLASVEDMLKARGRGERVIGVINAGAKAALDLLEGAGGDFAVGVLATPGTISSGAYERTLRQMAALRGVNIPVVCQSGYGFAEAVDNDPLYVDASLHSPRSAYRGPRLGTADADIKEELLPLYNFDRDGLLYTLSGDLMTDIQLNSASNYARFNMVSLLERYRETGLGCPLKAIILGCTHYPFELKTLQLVIEELRSYCTDGKYPYRDLLDDDIVFIDPARYTAAECYGVLREEGLLRKGRRARRVEAYISVPKASLDMGYLSGEGQLSFEYKYGREALVEDVGTRFVPFSDSNVDAGNRERIGALLPVSYKEIFAK